MLLRVLQQCTSSTLRHLHDALLVRHTFPWLTCVQLWRAMESGSQRVVLELVRRRWTLADLDLLPWGVALPLRQALHQCRSSPPSKWPQEAYVLIGMWHASTTVHGSGLVHSCGAYSSSSA